MGLNVAVDDLHRHGIHRHAAGAVDDAICYDSLGINSRKRLRCVAGENWCSWVCHCVVSGMNRIFEDFKMGSREVWLEWTMVKLKIFYRQSEYLNVKTVFMLRLWVNSSSYTDFEFFNMILVRGTLQ